MSYFSDLDLESAFRIRYRNFGLDFVYIFYNVSGIRNADSNSKSKSLIYEVTDTKLSTSTSTV
jgi:hypothetical protein